MKQVLNHGRNIVVEEVPAPLCEENQVLVANMYSLISVGTESASLSQNGVTSLASKAINNPELINRAIDLVRREGLTNTIKIIKKGTTESLFPLGYSSSGIVLEVGEKVNDLAVGDRVACAGAGYANHAEIISVPRNLVVKIPKNVDFDEAAFITVGAIAMQGIRRANVQFGDNVVVLGLGLLGQIACQILKAAGTNVIGIDMIHEKLDLAKKYGADKCLISDNTVVNRVIKYTEGIGADSIIVYAATKSNEPVKQAMEMARKKGKVVVVGDVGMDIDRSPFYEKELDFLISSSYGPGRYDKSYEEKGIDYPVGYVRWTENRNMKEFLKMISKKKVEVKGLINHIFSVEEAQEAYEMLNSEKRPIGVLFKYKNTTEKHILRKVKLNPIKTTFETGINVAMIGAGNFAQNIHLPNFKKIPFYNLNAVVTKNPHNAKKIAEEYNAGYYTTNYQETLEDKNIDLIVISTRHNLHTPLILDAAYFKKHILVEKPLAMNYMDCKRIYNAIRENEVNLTVGFNRRFSSLAQEAKNILKERKNPLMINYRVNSAGMKKDHWINDPVEGGGAIIGEGCHSFDFCNWIIGESPTTIYAEMISSDDQSIVDNNNVMSTIKYEDGSLASIIYTTIGNESFPKENIEIFCDNEIILIDNFKKLQVVGDNSKSRNLNEVDKGYFEFIHKYGEYLLNKTELGDIPTVEDGINATICSLKVIDALKTGKIQKWNVEF